MQLLLNFSTHTNVLYVFFHKLLPQQNFSSHKMLFLISIIIIIIYLRPIIKFYIKIHLYKIQNNQYVFGENCELREKTL